ncbi:MAG: DUF4398 domain-containing protein [Proteobacteria bacterium]|nr:DUF4398 domain-containing protein [Pseudomonadota bacterium]
MVISANTSRPTGTSSLVFAVALLLCELAGGCGPIGYVNQVTRKASAAVAAAKTARAETYSPYWYTLAVEYLHKAREEAAFADFEAANRFGRKAREAAVKAKEEAIARAADPSNIDWLPPPALRGEDSPDSPAAPDGSQNAPQDAGQGLAPVIRETPSGQGDPAGDGDEK